MAEFIKDQKKIINAWASFDLANSAYNLVITAAIFPIYYKAVTTLKDLDGNEISNTVSFLGIELKNTTLYDYAIAFAYLLVVCISPLLSGIADYSGNKKAFMKFFSFMGAASCGSMYFFTTDTLYLGIVLVITACVGYAGSLVFYNAYLPEIASAENQDKVSAKGYALGYIGSAILLMVNLALVMSQETGAEKLKMMQWAFVSVGIWWFGFSQITFHYLPKGNAKKGAEKNNLLQGYKELKGVWGNVKKSPQLKRFLSAFFVYSMGVQTIMLIANHFGSDEIKMDSTQLITTILIIQFLAMLGAYLFSASSSKFGNIFTIKIAVFIWAMICICTYLFVYTPVHFYFVAAFVGLVMGGIQSLSRSTYSKMLPETKDHTSYFSFYEVCEKTSIVLGMVIFGFINEISATMRTPIIALVSFFILGLILLFRVPELKSNK